MKRLKALAKICFVFSSSCAWFIPNSEALKLFGYKNGVHNPVRTVFQPFVERDG